MLMTENFDLRDEVQQELHNMQPKWWMRYGVSTVFVILIIIITLSYIVKYPDVITADLRLTTNKPSVNLALQQGGQIEEIFKRNGDFLTAFSPILVLRNDAKYQDVFFLEEKLNTFTFNKDTIIYVFNDLYKRNLQLGTIIESNWLSFSNQLFEFYKIEELGKYQSQIDFLNKELIKQLNLKKYYQNLIRFDHAQNKLSIKKIDTDSVLLSKGVISLMTFNDSKNVFLETSKGLQQNKLFLERTKLEIVKIRNAIDNNTNSEKEGLLISELNIRKYLNQLNSSISMWKKNYVLVTPVDGFITFVQDLKVGGAFEGRLATVVSDDKSFYASIKIPLSGAGKVKTGQRIVIKLNDFPYREFGVIEGELIEIALVPGENYYLGKVYLAQYDKTTYENKINLNENMKGIGEIITNNRSILERIFEKIVYVFQK